MESPLYIRIKGRVQGPFDLEKLRTLVKRGQLGRAHEVSGDGSSWQRAADYPELFTAPKVEKSATRLQESDPYEIDTGDEVKREQGKGSEAVWYYAQGDSQSGPVEFATLRRLIATGQVLPSDVVWKEGMVDWSKANTVPGLVPESPTSDPRRQEGGALGASIARLLADSKPWVLFTAIIAFIYGALFGVGGIWFLIEGSRNPSNNLTESGIGAILYAAVAFGAGSLAMSYHGRIVIFLREKDQPQLDAVLRSLKRIWVSIGVFLIVVVVFTILAVLFGLSQASRL